MSTRWIAPALAAVVVLFAGLAVYLALEQVRAGGETDNRLRLAINPWPGYELLYLADVRDLYAKEGLDVQLVQFSTLDDARRSFERGQVDAIATTLVDVVQIYHDTGEKPQIVLAADYSKGGDMIVARGKEISTVAALKGRTIAAEQMFGRFILSGALRRHGLTLDDVKVIESSVLDGQRLLESGKVDAIVTFPPHSIGALNVAGTRRIFDTREIPEQVFDVVAVRRSAVDRIPDLEHRIQRVWARALEQLESTPAEAIRIMARREGITDDEFRAALADIHLIPAERQPDMLGPGGPIERALAQLVAFRGWTGPVERPAPVASAFMAPPVPLGTVE